MDTGVAHSQAGLDMLFDKLKGKSNYPQNVGCNHCTGARAHLMPVSDRLLMLLAEGVDVAREHPNTSYACGIATALVALPGALSAQFWIYPPRGPVPQSVKAN